MKIDRTKTNFAVSRRVIAGIMIMLMLFSNVQPAFAKEYEQNEIEETEVEDKESSVDTDVLEINNNTQENTGSYFRIQLTFPDMLESDTTGRFTLMDDDETNVCIRNAGIDGKTTDPDTENSEEDKTIGFEIKLEGAEGLSLKDSAMRFFDIPEEESEMAVYEELIDGKWSKLDQQQEDYVIKNEGTGRFLLVWENHLEKSSDEQTSSCTAETGVEQTEREAEEIKTTEEEAYAILYSNGDLIFQRGNNPDGSKGDVIATFTGFEENAGYAAKDANGKDYAVTPWLKAEYADLIKNIEVIDVIRPRTIAWWFGESNVGLENGYANLTNLVTADLRKLDVSRVTSFYCAFQNCTSLKILNITGWNVGNVVNMSSTFNNCTSLEILDVGEWDMRNVAKMDCTFQNCKSLKTLDVRNWNLENLITLSCTFQYCSSLEELDVSYWRLGKLTSLNATFNGCKLLKVLDVKNWGIQKVITINSTFKNCSSIEVIDANNWDVSNCTIMTSTFSGCTSLIQLNIDAWNTGKVTNMNFLFQECRSLKFLVLSKWNTGRVIGMYAMFQNCKTLESLDISGFNMEHVTSISFMFYGCSSLRELDLDKWKTDCIASMNATFSSCSALKILNLGNWNTKNTTLMTNFLKNCNSLFILCVGENTIFLSDAAIPSAKWKFSTDNSICDTKEIYEKRTNGTFYRSVTIGFQANGGIGSSRIVTYADDLSFQDEKVEHPYRSGYVFTGWYTKKTGGEKLNENSEMTESVYYAHWSCNRYKLILSDNNPNILSTGQKEQTIETDMDYDEFYTLTDQLFKCDGYVLSGWNTKRNGSGTSYKATSVVCNLASEESDEAILYAQWKPESDYITVSFDTQDGTEKDPVRIKKGESLKNLSEPQKTGYTFLGWHMHTVDGESVTTETQIQESCTLVVAWGKNPTVTFDSGIAGITQKTIVYNGKIGTMPSYPSNQGRHQVLMGWFTEKEGGVEVSEDTIVTEDITYHAHWGWAPKFNANGGKIIKNVTFPPQENPIYTITEFPEAERDGYIFAGWYQKDTEVEKEVDLSIENEVTAKWTRKKICKITLDPKDGSYDYDKQITIEKGSLITGIYHPSKKGYTFLGWKDENGVYYKNGDKAEKDLSLTAVWCRNECKITFDPDEGDMDVKSLEVRKGSTLNVIPGAKKSGFILKGWYTTENEELTTDTVITEDVTYHAVYEPVIQTYVKGDYTYTFGAEWSNASNDDVSNVSSNLNFHPSGNNPQTASLHLRYELNKAIGEKMLPAGSVKIRVPKYLWKDWNGKWTGTNNISANLPKYPDKRNGMYFSYMEDEDSYILVNNEDLTGGMGLDFTLSYRVSPSDVPGGAEDVNGEYLEGYTYGKGTVNVIVSVDAGTVQTESRKLTAEMHTKVIPEAALSYNSVSYRWDENWGEKPADADDYFYVTWRAEAYFNAYQTQKYSYYWTEDTDHEGTVINIDSGRKDGTGEARTFTFITIKYPNRLLKNMPTSGVKVTNQAVLNTVWKSGYETKQAVSAETKIYGYEGTNGEFGKNNTTGTVRTIAAAQEDLAYDQKKVCLKWNLNYAGDSKEVVWNEDMQAYTSSSRMIELVDGDPGDIMYSSGSAESKYIWEPDTENYTLSDEDYEIVALHLALTEYDSKCVGGNWTEKFEHENLTDYKGVSIYLRYKGEKEYKYYRYVTGDNVSISLPEDVVGYKIRHESTFYGTTIKATGTFYLKPTVHVSSLIGKDLRDGTTSIIKDKSVCNIWNTETGKKYYSKTNYTGGTNPANQVCYELGKSATYQYTKNYAGDQSRVIFDSNKGTQDDVMQISGYLRNTGSGRNTPMTSGIFYNLLPKGTTVDVNTVIGLPITNNGYAYDQTSTYESLKTSKSCLSSNLYDVQFENNYEGSGRTMMIIKWTAPNLESTKVTGMNFLYLLHNTYENVVEHGTSVENDVALVNTSEQSAKPSKIYDKQSIITNASVYDSLQQKYDEYISYAKASTDYIPVSAFSWGFNKTVKGQGSEYLHTDETLPNEEYTYKLTYNQSDNAVSDAIQFYDVLEYGSESKNESGETVLNLSGWHGTLKDVDVSSIEKKLTSGSDSVHCKPVVYYSTKDRASFTNADYSVANTDTWSVKEPKDKSTITAIAIDCSKNEDGTDFVLKGKQSLSVYITMTAPDDKKAYDRKAYNTSLIYSKKENDLNPTSMVSDAEITLKKEKVELHKTSSPESGSMEVPSEVFKDTSLDYTLSVTNKNEKATVHEIVVEDEIPEGLLVNTDNIQVCFGDKTEKISVTESPRISMKKDGRKLCFTIHSLAAGEKTEIIVPTIVSTGTGTFINTAKILRINGVKRDIVSETTYHQAKEYKEYSLTIRKVNNDGKLLGGATLELTGRSIYDPKDITPIRWTTETDVEKVISLTPGDYTLTELTAPDGYVVAEPIRIHLVKDETVTMLDVNETSLTVYKKWDDEQKKNERPESVAFTLYRDGLYYKEFTVSEADGWEKELNDLPEFAAGDVSHKYQYTIKEKETKYIATYEYAEDGTVINVTNHLPTSAVLPSTGRVTLFILLLVIAAVLLYVVWIRRRR